GVAAPSSLAPTPPTPVPSAPGGSDGGVSCPSGGKLPPLPSPRDAVDEDGVSPGSVLTLALGEERSRPWLLLLRMSWNGPPSGKASPAAAAAAAGVGVGLIARRCRMFGT
ncbi:unnamed protein product, partial [Ectocarpus sp. 12 AP-2014]